MIHRVSLHATYRCSWAITVGELMRKGIFVLADIGGYTAFLTDVGITHAKEITAHLLNGMFEVDSDTWRLGDVEGDCLFVYSDSGVSSEDVFSYLRRLYERFRESLEDVISGSTCRCGACDRSGDLTLKFVVHGGEFDVEKIAGQQQLIGPDIVVAHRLLKNSVPIREYALVTAPLAEIAEGSGFSVAKGRDDYDDIGVVDYVYVNFEEVREAFYKSQEIFLTEADADVAVSIEIDAPPDFVWSCINDPDLAPQLFPTLVKFEKLSGYEKEAGSVHTCLHGDNVMMVHYRVAYDEGSRRITDKLSNVLAVERMLQTVEVEPCGTGSKLNLYYSIRPGVPIEDEEMRSGILKIIRQHSEGDAKGVKTHCEAEYPHT